MIGLLVLLSFPAAAAGWVEVPAGPFLMGSTPAQIEQAYRISADGYGNGRVREYGWFDREAPQRSIQLPAFRIQKTVVTNQAYRQFVEETGHSAPHVDKKTWVSYGLVHPYARARQYMWAGDHPPMGKENHPVVLVSIEDARAYAAWLSNKTGRRLRLPSEPEWEKAMRGVDGSMYPWGDDYDPALLNNADRGPFATMPVGVFPDGASPYGVLDGAGQVYEWTGSSWPGGKYVVKGGSWDDHGGICRPAARHGRPPGLKHVLIGFRLLEDLSSGRQGD
ncbi:MAG: SUMF1/EgtB/PvdO family nonheme iron enzyme [Mariprofundaceae bacterium]